MLSELKLKNFKSIAEAGLSLSTVTVLIGENGSGKSSFVQSLAVLKQSLGSGQLSLHGPIIDVGSFDELLHQPAEEGGEIAFELAGEARYGRPIAIEKSDNVAFEYAWAANATSTVRMHHGLKSGQRFNIESAWSRLGQSSVMPPSVVIDGLAFAFGVATGIGQGIVVAGRGQQRSDIDEATSRRVEQSVQSVLTATANVIQKTFFVPAIRGSERQFYDLGDSVTVDLISPDGSLRVSQNLATTVAYKRELEETIGAWMARVTGRGVHVGLIPGRRVLMFAVKNDLLVNLANEGFGSNQLSHVLTQLALLPDDAVLAIEEPEIHLHPAAQTRLVNVLVEAVRAKTGQLLMTTHSEHILYALMALVAEGVLKPEDVAVNHVAFADGATTARRLDVDSSGRIKGGLPGFFNVHIQEFRRFLDAVDKNQ